MPDYGAAGLSSAITYMLHANEGQIATAIDKKTKMTAWVIVGAAVIAVLFLVKRMGK